MIKQYHGSCLLHLREAEVENVVIKFGNRVEKMFLLAIRTAIFTAQNKIAQMAIVS